ncbi:MAG TPA: hypothetical protein PKB14_06125 [Rubrivivax sp.]|nr:hypothetical protein [Rubrivivax sp.]
MLAAIDTNVPAYAGGAAGACLLALATEHGGRLVTLDRGIAVQAVPRATARNLVTLSAA